MSLKTTWNQHDWKKFIQRIQFLYHSALDQTQNQSGSTECAQCILYESLCITLYKLFNVRSFHVFSCFIFNALAVHNVVECVCGMQDNAIYFTNNQIGLEYKYAFYAFSNMYKLNDTNRCWRIYLWIEKNWHNEDTFSINLMKGKAVTLSTNVSICHKFSPRRDRRLLKDELAIYCLMHCQI